MAASMESYFKVALNQFVGHFSEVCNEKEMQLTLKETGDAVKPDLLFRMMYELILSEEPTEDYKQPEMPKTKIPEARGRTEDQAPRPSSTYTGIKVSFKDIKKVEKAAKLQFPFMPDFIDYKCNNTCCQCLRVCGNMFVPCGTHVKDWDPEDGTIPTCKTCANQKNEENYGNLAMRMEAYDAGKPYVAPEKEKEEGAAENAKGPKGPKKELTFGTYLAKKGLLGNDAKLRTAKLNEKIQELENLIFQETNLTYSFGPEHLTIDKSKVRASKKSGDGEAKRTRGRPKKERSASVSSTSSEEEENSSQPSSPIHEDPVEEKVQEKAKDPEDEQELHMDEVSSSDVEVEEEDVEVQEEDLEVEEEQPESPKEQPESPKEEPESPKEEPESPKEEPEKPKEEPEKPKEEPEKPKEEPEKPKEEPEKPKEEDTKATKKLKKVTVNGKVLFIDRKDMMVYDENMEYYGDFDKKKGKIIPLK